MSRLFCFGLGYSAEALSRRLTKSDWSIAGTARDPGNVERLSLAGYDVCRFAGEPADDEVPARLAGATHILLSIPPSEGGDPVLRHFRGDIAGLKGLTWIGYLSTVGVYGDHDGALVDETAALKAQSARGKARIEAERAWLAFGAETGVPVQVFRLAGIYGPGRSALDKVRAGTARTVIKPGQVFSRIHVQDIAHTLEASIAHPRAGGIYNVADDEPSPPQDVIVYAAALLGVSPPEAVPFDEAELSPMARSFYGDNRRIANALIKSELGVRLAFPTYREGLTALNALAK